MPQNKRHKKIVVFCLVFSMVVHIIALTVLHNHAIRSFFHSERHIATTNSITLPQKSPRQILNMIFHQKSKNQITTKISSNLPSFQPQEETVDFAHKESQKQTLIQVESQPQNSLDFQLSQIEEKLILPDISSQDVLKKEESFPFVEKISNAGQIAPHIYSALLSENIPVAQSASFESLPSTFLNEEEENTVSSSILDSTIKNISDFLSLKTTSSHPLLLFANTPLLFQMPTLEELTTITCKEDFDMDISFTPKENEEGYLFAITLIPKPNLNYKRLKQNFYFLIDRSNSIQKNRLTQTRHAILSSLNLLNESDNFNILAFDSKMDQLSSSALNVNSSSISRAKSFLFNQNLGSFFSATNFSLPLFKLLSDKPKDDEINIAILISNGEDLSKAKNYKFINEWSKQNKGNLCIYSLALCEDKNLNLLDFFSSINKGKLLYSSNTNGLKRKLQKLVKSLNFPIAKNIVTTTVSKDPLNKITLYPSNQFPNLYLDEPYIIFGSCTKLQDFTLVIQGKHSKDWLSIQKQISFDSAKESSNTLKTLWVQKKSSRCYEQFLVDGNPKHLFEAKNLLDTVTK
ncbi:MAG: hypothetical protein HZB76_04880 [Chlamydiae bacterium]|nr:hypothetical protein [Chlamydiota bacterium]